MKKGKAGYDLLGNVDCEVYSLRLRGSGNKKMTGREVFTIEFIAKAELLRKQ